MGLVEDIRKDQEAEKLKQKLQLKQEEKEDELVVALFKKNREITEGLSKNFAETFAQLHEKVLANIIRETKQETEATINEKTAEAELAREALLTPNAFKRWTNKATPPEKSSIVRYAIAAKIDLLTTATLLRSGGYQFNLADEKEWAWAYLIMHYSGRSIAECNKKLKKLGYNEKQHNAYFLKKRQTKSNSKKK